MRLVAWRKEQGWTVRQLARRLHVSAATASRWERHLALPSHEQLAHVYLLTDGAVAPNDFVDLPPLSSDLPPLSSVSEAAE